MRLECLRLMLTLKLDEARMELIGTFVDAYPRLNAEQTREFEQRLERARLAPQEKKKMLDYVTSWEQKGIEKGITQGIAQGLAQGFEKGVQEGIERERQTTLGLLHEMAIKAVAARFGEVPPKLAERIHAVESPQDLRAFVDRALSAKKLADLKL